MKYKFDTQTSVKSDSLSVAGVNARHPRKNITHRGGYLLTRSTQNRSNRREKELALPPFTALLAHTARSLVDFGALIVLTVTRHV